VPAFIAEVELDLPAHDAAPGVAVLVASIWAAHFTPSPVIADGPVIAEENPTRMGRRALRRAPRQVSGKDEGQPPTTPIRGPPRRCHRALLARRSASICKFLARLREPAHAAGDDLDRVLVLHAAPAVP